MKYVENPIFGRKIFFLNSPLSIENVAAAELRQKEYEVYVIRDYTLAKPILRKFPNAICWIFIDDELTYSAWVNFIKSFEYDEELKSIFVGVLTARAKPKDQEFFMLNTQLPGGFIRLDQKLEDATNQLIGILDLNGARGSRKCIRLDVSTKKDVIAYFSNGTNMFSFQLREVSPLGFSALTPIQMAGLFKKGTFIHNVSITLGRYSFTCTIQIYHATTIKNLCIVVATFSDDTTAEIRKKIHDYIYQSLEYSYKEMCEELPHDSENYNNCPTVGGNVEPAEEVEEAEEVKDSEKASDKDSKTEDKTEGTDKTPEDKTPEDGTAKKDETAKAVTEEKAEDSADTKSDDASKDEETAAADKTDDSKKEDAGKKSE